MPTFFVYLIKPRLQGPIRANKVTKIGLDLNETKMTPMNCERP